ncbi:mycofactocin-coupled SDR family oxidoreductase [Nocardia cyriacigeorgica]|uniref:Mycofactocin-coupled SDR family oxidoreductase n=1 Tax=Nocardia cyriacigeorgica TaxID=135487 RepID=A0A6P1DBK2_9NOCA|nr:mycofactocin-coupled SDR family oxidoreductase [Nocardia cyriacigeorgica]NEW39878.1 mycofactocin-coupled SDR family oxidoreductase [Nocardia cyriacigeorgica]NEW45702.1 mycofactocin-coupled SDR family oxidoreductase [Nocardia cyriacigeorgica]NEW51363.1 mycofactocin-coupled SDR family oxidoreductase [Nocardia cyriacigeorgica]NEW55418.1 mycofactocin-coupled SDR family oxidoreductase [Nocardia cyriacigeorgica]
MVSSRRFEDRVVVITGAARGQGRAEAIRFAEEGADIIAIDACTQFESTPYAGATAADLEETVRSVEKTGRRVVARTADVRDFAALSQAVSEGIEQFGRLDVVVANAGICSVGLSWEITAEQWRETVDVNLTGVFHTAKATVPYLIEQGTGGAIVFTSSVAGLKGVPFTGHYVATKHGITGLAKTMANELGAHRIRVNTVHPAGVETGMDMRAMGPLLDQYAATLSPMYMNTLPDTISQPEDIAATVAWICSDDARHVTGTQIPVDMGNLNR